MWLRVWSPQPNAISDRHLLAPHPRRVSLGDKDHSKGVTIRYERSGVSLMRVAVS